MIRTATFAFVLASGAVAAPVEIEQFMPKPGTYDARDMQLAAPAEYARIAQRLGAVAKANPEWFKSYVAQHEGAVLPYHSNFGVTEAEYRTFLELGNKMTLAEAARVELKVVDAPGARTLSASGGAAALNGFKIDPEGNFVQTPNGRLTVRTRIDQQDAASPTGRWTGVQWRSEEETAKPEKLAMGLRENGGRIIYYSAPGNSGPIILCFEDSR